MAAALDDAAMTEPQGDWEAIASLSWGRCTQTLQSLRQHIEEVSQS